MVNNTFVVSEITRRETVPAQRLYLSEALVRFCFLIWDGMGIFVRISMKAEHLIPILAPFAA